MHANTLMSSSIWSKVSCLDQGLFPSFDKNTIAKLTVQLIKRLSSKKSVNRKFNYKWSRYLYGLVRIGWPNEKEKWLFTRRHTKMIFTLNSLLLKHNSFTERWKYYSLFKKMLNIAFIDKTGIDTRYYNKLPWYRYWKSFRYCNLQLVLYLRGSSKIIGIRNIEKDSILSWCFITALLSFSIIFFKAAMFLSVTVTAVKNTLLLFDVE